jgi:hypothetical protein
LAALLGADRKFGRLWRRLGRNDPADMLKHFARVLAVGSIGPVLDAAQLLSQIAALFKPALANDEYLLPIII